ncbi:hypothetical protein [Halalkalirubrum salinum]|uniref:hypothetical protein n=1 Tax=Halalkalirubrum salinum TaxID=2563889 RepID=UPI0010FAE006|nr:hypothetical protein [Halalkalirubrum salinum]
MSEKIDRMRLNLRVDEDVKQAFNSEVKFKFGKCRPYAGVELERELRYFLDQGEIAELRKVVCELADSSENSTNEKNSYSTNRDKTTVVSYRIAEDIRNRLVTVAEDDFRSPGELVEAIMYGYTTEGSAIERLTQKLKKVAAKSHTDERDSISAKERRTKTIAQELEGGEFKLDDFDEAVKLARGIGVGDHAREEYLPRVLEELDYTWHPQNPELFIEGEIFDFPDVRDPTNKPLILMDEEDKRLAIKVAAYRNKTKSFGTTFSIDEAVDLFRGKVRRSTVRPLMRDIADTSPGYKYNQKRNMLNIDKKLVKRHPNENQEVLIIVHR